MSFHTSGYPYLPSSEPPVYLTVRQTTTKGQTIRLPALLRALALWDQEPGITQGDMAKRLGVDLRTLGRILAQAERDLGVVVATERGTRDPSVSILSWGGLSREWVISNYGEEQ